MSDIKRIAIFIVVIIAVVAVSTSFVGSDILDRAIIIGLGVDSSEEGVRITAGGINPGNGSEQIGTYSKTVSANGSSVGQALNRMAELTGKEASLGRCLLIVLGQDLYEKEDFGDIINYFIESDSFKESSAICCANGSAEELFNKGSAMTQSVSFALTALLQEQSEKVAIVTNNLLNYTLSQRELFKTGFLNKVAFVASQNTDASNPAKVQGYFTLDETVIFRENEYVYTLGKDETRAFALFDDDVLGDTFTSDASGNMLTINVNSKKVDKKVVNDQVEINIKLYAKLAKTDSADVEGIFVSKDKMEIPKETIEDITEYATQLAETLINKQTEYNFDILKIHEIYRRKQGATYELANKPMTELPIKLKLEIVEK